MSGHGLNSIGVCLQKVANNGMEWTLSHDVRLPAAKEIQVWRSQTGDEPARAVESLLACLPPDEQERAGRFKFEKDRNLFVTAHAGLRSVLSIMLEIEPSRIGFDTNEHGKPFLNPDRHNVDLHFNLTHSHQQVLWVIATGAEVGVDVEYVRDNVNELDLARRYFSPREVEVLEQEEPPDRRQRFFECWTRKEAFVKTQGSGLFLPLRKFSVELNPERTARILDTEWDPSEAAGWSLWDLSCGPGYVGAVAVRETGCSLHLHEWAGI